MIIFRSLPSRVLRITSPFGMRRHPITGVQTMHNGVDIAPHRQGATDDEIRAVMSGTISRNFWNNARGWVVEVNHGVINKQRVYTLYQHLAQRSPLQIGARVDAGQQIGVMGTTGASTGIHLHFELKVSGRLIDPEPFLRNIQPEEEEMTQERFNEMMNTWLQVQRSLPESDWSVTEGMFKTATDKNVVDGTAPRGFVTREQITAILGRLGLLK